VRANIQANVSDAWIRITYYDFRYVKTIYPEDLSHRDRHQLLLGGVAPRPVAFVATLDVHGTPNLAPFSFFGAYSSKPPTVAIGPAIGAKTGLAKDTLLNLVRSKECTISAVSYAMVHQTNLTSAPYPHGISEFEKGGFMMSPSTIVAPPFVAESPFSMECKLVEYIEIRRDIGGNGNILLLEVVAFHVSDHVWDNNGAIDPHKMDLVGRMGLSWYTRARETFWAVQPPHIPIAMDGLPEHIRRSTILTGNDLARLAYLPNIPVSNPDFIKVGNDNRDYDLETELTAGNPAGALLSGVHSGAIHDETTRHRIAKCFLDADMVDEAWQTLLLV